MKKTKDYDNFKILPGNRMIVKSHLLNLEQSILENNLLYCNPIIVSKEGYVMDGQHRLEVAKRNNLEIYYLVAEESDIDDVINLNVNQKGWAYQDYLESYIEQGKSAYKLLDRYIKEYDIPLSSALFLLAGSKTRGTVQDAFKKGTFEVVGLKEAEEFGLKLADYKGILPSTIWRSRTFIAALDHLYKNGVSHDRMIKKFVQVESSRGSTIDKQASFKDYLRVLEEIYNYGMSVNYERFF